MKHILAKTILISEVVELIAKKHKITYKDAMDLFYNSDVINLLDDEKTGLYGESALFIFSLYELGENRK